MVAQVFLPPPPRRIVISGWSPKIWLTISTIGFLGIFVIAQEPYLLGPSIHFYLSLNQVWQISMARYKRAPRVFFGKYHILVYQKVVLQPWCQNMIFLLWKLCLHVNLESFIFSKLCQFFVCQSDAKSEFCKILKFWNLAEILIYLADLHVSHKYTK